MIENEANKKIFDWIFHLIKLTINSESLLGFVSFVFSSHLSFGLFFNFFFASHRLKRSLLILFQTIVGNAIQDSEGERETGETPLVSLTELRGPADDQGHRARGGEVRRRLQADSVSQNLHSPIRTSLNPVCRHQRIYW